MKKLNVLVFPCGSENAGEIYQALRYSLHINRLIGASSCEDHGRLHFPDYIGDVPFISNEQFAGYFCSLLATHEIDVVFATHDSVAETLAPLVGRVGVYLVNGHPETAKILRRKSLTYEMFSHADWVPRVYSCAAEITCWPVIIKPDCGQGGNGVYLAHNPQELEQASGAISDPLLVEYLPGQEITVDCFTDRNANLIWVGPRSRERVRAGIAMRSASFMADDAIQAMAEQINEAMKLRGPWFFQAKQDVTGRWKLLEISCRIAGTMVMQRARGVNMPLMALHDYLGRDVLPLVTPHVSLIERYIKTRAVTILPFEQVYVDLDDTLIINGRANPVVMAFLYQCRAENKRIYLITRHISQPHETLRQAAISEQLFDDIYHLQHGQNKSAFVQPNSIFIDNYFPERRDVASLNDTLVLDVDAVDFYIK